jgi:hypothetical protein
LSVGISLAKDTVEKKRTAGDLIRSLSGGPGDVQVETRSPDNQVYGAISEYFDASIPPDTTSGDGGAGAD